MSKSIAVIISARDSSTRIKNKMSTPFAGRSLLDICLGKLQRSNIPNDNIFVSVYEDQLKDIASQYPFNIFERSKTSSCEADDPKIIYEWWDKLPSRFEYFVLINPCLPLLTIKTIERFISLFSISSSQSMFGVVSKKNFIFRDGVMVNHFKHFPPPNNKIMNTISVPPWQEAAHCLYGGKLSKIKDPDYLGSFDEVGSPELFEVPENEVFDIDYPWQLSHGEILYRGLHRKEQSHLIIGDTKIGPGMPVFIIAEIGCNHQGDLATCREMIRLAKEAGVDAVKLQKRTINEFMCCENLDKEYSSKHSFGNTYREHREALEFNVEEWKDLMKYAREIDILLFASVWDVNACREMVDVGMKLFKVSSADLRTEDLLHELQDKTVILSTGCSNMREIDRALRCFDRPVGLLQCTSAYPNNSENVNLRMIEEYKQCFGNKVVVGYSGHETDLHTTVGAVAAGAHIIERHVTLDRSMKGSDHSASLEFKELTLLVKMVRRMEGSLGSVVKTVLPCEQASRVKLGKRLVYVRDMEKGEEVKNDDICYKSPGNSSNHVYRREVVGKILKENVKKDQVVET